MRLKSVFVLERNIGNIHFIDGVFTSEKKANKYIKKHKLINCECKEFFLNKK